MSRRRLPGGRPGSSRISMRVLFSKPGRLPAVLRPLCLWLFVAMAQNATAAAALPLCPWDPVATDRAPTIVDVDKVWSGARVDFAGATIGNQFVIGYYDQERWLTV